MRKINKSNKKAFGAFGVVVLILLIGFGAVMVYAVINAADSYASEKGLIIYDKNCELINTDADGKISKSWNKEYYIDVKHSGSYELGEHSVAMVPGSREVRIYGSGYQVKTDGSVVSIDGETKVPNKGIEAKLFKLADRRYLLTGGDIVSVEQGLQTRTYLDIYIDKSGNAQLVNDEVNLKTVNPMKLVCGDITFDIGNEKMIVGEKEIDLKAIGGSTNKYKDKTDTKKNSSSSTTNNQSSTSGSTGGGTSGGGTSSGTTANLDKSITLRGTQPNVNSIKVNYSITDIENNYISCYLLVSEPDNEGEEPTRIELNKADTTIDVRGLKPDTLYQISLCYDNYVKSGKGTVLKQNIQNVVQVRTATVPAEISVERLTDKYLTVKVEMEDEYVLDSADLVVTDESRDPITVASININKAISGGWTKKIYVGSVSENTNSYIMSIENAKYAGEAINIKSKYTIKNSLISFIINKLRNI